MTDKTSSFNNIHKGNQFRHIFITIMDFIIKLLLFSLCITFSYQRSCYRAGGEKYICNARSCPKNLKCKGNYGKDGCNCCTVCLKQENERCGGIHGKCDHHAPYCEKIGKSKRRRCITLKTALLHEIPKYTREIRECKDRREQSIVDMLKCIQSSITYYCKKKPEYIAHKDCCLGSGGGAKCNPNVDVYEELNVDVTLQYMEPEE